MDEWNERIPADPRHASCGWWWEWWGGVASENALDAIIMIPAHSYPLACYMWYFVVRYYSFSFPRYLDIINYLTLTLRCCSSVKVSTIDQYPKHLANSLSVSPSGRLRDLKQFNVNYTRKEIQMYIHWCLDQDHLRIATITPLGLPSTQPYLSSNY